MYVSVRFIGLICVFILIYILYRALWKGEGFGFLIFKKKKQSPINNKEKSNGMVIAQMRKDPVCGTYIPENQAISHKHSGETHYFCSENCWQKFKEEKKK